MATSHHPRTGESPPKAEANNQLNVASLRSTLGISRERMGRVLDVSSRTIQRWEESDQLPSNRWVREVLIDLDKVLQLGHEIFTPDGLRNVMTQPQPVFDNRSGLDLIESGDAQRIIAEFAGVYEGYAGT